MTRRFVFVSTLGYPPERVGGAQISTLTLAQQLSEKGHEVEICFPQEFEETFGQRWWRQLIGRHGVPRRRLGIRQVVFRSLRTTRFETYLAQVHQHILGTKPDLVIVGEGRTIDVAIRLCGLPNLAIFFRDVELDFQSQWTAHEARQQLAEMTFHGIANSAFVAAHFQQLTAKNIPHFPPMIDLSKYEASTSEPFLKGEEVLFVNPVPLKGLHLALEIVDLLPDVPFCFLEAWPLKGDIEEEVMKELEARPNIRFQRAISDIRQAFARSGCVIVPSKWEEAWCRVISEAQAWGLPVIARDIGGIEEALGGAGILMDRDADPASWAQAIQELFRAPERQEKLRALGFERAKADDLRGDALVKHIENLANGKNH